MPTCYHKSFESPLKSALCLYLIHTHTHIHTYRKSIYRIYVNRTIQMPNESQMDKRYCFWYFYGIFFLLLCQCSLWTKKKTRKRRRYIRYVCVFEHFQSRLLNEGKWNIKKKNWKWSVNKAFLRRFFFSHSLLLPLPYLRFFVPTDKS